MANGWRSFLGDEKRTKLKSSHVEYREKGGDIPMHRK